MQAVKAEEPWAAPYGQMGKVWIAIADRFTRLVQLSSSTKPPDDRACKDRYTALYTKQKQLDTNPAARSGSSEEFGEVEQGLAQCIEATESHKRKVGEQKEKEREKEQETEDTQKRLRDHTLKSLGQRRPISQVSVPSSPSSSAEGNESTDAEGGHPKRQKPTIRLQQQMIADNAKRGEALQAQMSRLVTSADLLSAQSVRSNDILDQLVAKF